MASSPTIPAIQLAISPSAPSISESTPEIASMSTTKVNAGEEKTVDNKKVNGESVCKTNTPITQQSSEGPRSYTALDAPLSDYSCNSINPFNIPVRNDPGGYYSDAYARIAKQTGILLQKANGGINDNRSESESQHRVALGNSERYPNSGSGFNNGNNNFPRRETGFGITERFYNNSGSDTYDRPQSRLLPMGYLQSHDFGITEHRIDNNSARVRESTINHDFGGPPTPYSGNSEQRQTYRQPYVFDINDEMDMDDDQLYLPHNSRLSSGVVHRSQCPQSTGMNDLRKMYPYANLLAPKDKDEGKRRTQRKLEVAGHKVTTRGIQESDDYDEDDGSHLSATGEDDAVFVEDEETGTRCPRVCLATPRHRVQKLQGGDNTKITERFISDDFIDSNRTAPTKRPFEQDPAAYHRDMGARLRPSRYSGSAMPWGLNQKPEAVPQEDVTDAALMKRNLKRGAGKQIVKRGYGANDPENISIVNMKDVDGMSFADICSFLNQRRTANGKNPTLTVCGVNGRYNRTAPLLYEAQGKVFIPPSKRRKGIKADDPDPQRVVAWSNDLDVELVKAVKEYDEGKWGAVAHMMEDRTKARPNADQCAVRFNLL